MPNNSSGLLASRRDICRMLSTMSLTRRELVRMICSRCLSSSEGPRFLQQLTGVAHCAHRIADFMSDAGSEPAERRQL